MITERILKNVEISVSYQYHRIFDQKDHPQDIVAGWMKSWRKFHSGILSISHIFLELRSIAVFYTSAEFRPADRNL